jgi:multiple sugar transport system permease protein
MVTQVTVAPRGSRRRIFGETGLDSILPYLLLAPTVVLVLAVLVYPLIEGVRTSTGFYRFGRRLRDVGLDNYVQALHDPAFLGSVVTTLEFVAAVVILETALGLALALLCAREVRFVRAVRGSLILPMIVTPVVVGIIFRLIYASDVGLVATLARSVGLAPPEILGRPNAAFAGLVLLDVWEWTPLMFLILLAGIQSLPVEPFEAAKVDGAGAWRTFVDHTLPMLRPTILVAVTLRSIDALTTFDQVYVLTRGGPGIARSSSPSTATRRSSSSSSSATPRRCSSWWRSSSSRRRGWPSRSCGGSDDQLPWRRIGYVVVVVAAVAFAVVPLLWMASTSLKSNREITQDGTLVPDSFTFANYASLFNGREFGAYLTNSIVVTAVSVAIALLSGRTRRTRWPVPALAGDGALRRARPPGDEDRAAHRHHHPGFLLAQGFGVLNSKLGLIVMYSAFNVSVVVWMMESFFREIPVDLEEAAMVDGDTRFAAFRRIVLPLAAPGLVATGIFAIIVTYNEFLFALVLTSTPSAETMPVGAATLIGRINIDWGAMSAAGGDRRPADPAVLRAGAEAPRARLTMGAVK